MRPPRGGNLDRNHDEIVQALTRAGIAVKSLAGAGEGIPDLLCAYRDMTVLLEVKDGTLPPGHRKLKASQIEFFAKWPGKAYVVTTGEEAVRCVIDAAKPCACKLDGGRGGVFNMDAAGLAPPPAGGGPSYR